MSNFDKEWEAVCKNLGYPNLMKPKIVDGKKFGVSTAQINMKSKEILISKDFMNELKIPYELSFTGISAHEANHYVTCPFNLKTKIVLDLEANSVNNEHGFIISNYFQDVIINLDLIKRNITEIVDVYSGIDTVHRVDETLRALYYLKTGLNFGLRNKNNVDVEVLKNLSVLNYDSLDIQEMKKNLRLFAEYLSPLFVSDEEPKMFIDSGLFKETSSQDIDRSLREIASEFTPEEYSIAKKILGLTQDDLIDKIDYYEALSLKYPLTVRKKEKKFGKISLDYSISNWDFDDGFSSVDYYKSSGKIFPGITKKRTSIEKNIMLPYKTEKDIPDALIIIDSSGSMVNPFHEKSNAVLASYVVSNYYLRRNKKVGVINFSSYSNFLDFSINKGEIFKSLIEFQGGGTTLNSSLIEKVVCENSKNSKDVYLITDFEIENRDDIVKKLVKSKKTNRINIFIIGSGNDYSKGKLKVHRVESENDLYGLIIDELKDYRNSLEASI